VCDDFNRGGRPRRRRFSQHPRSRFSPHAIAAACLAITLPVAQTVEAQRLRLRSRFATTLPDTSGSWRRPSPSRSGQRTAVKLRPHQETEAGPGSDDRARGKSPRARGRTVQVAMTRGRLLQQLVGQRHRKLVETNQVRDPRVAWECLLVVFRLSAEVDIIATFKPIASEARELGRRQNRTTLPVRRHPVGVDVCAYAAR